MAKIKVWAWKCERCGHVWLPRQPKGGKPSTAPPKMCAKCKSAYWDVPRREK